MATECPSICNNICMTTAAGPVQFLEMAPFQLLPFRRCELDGPVEGAQFLAGIARELLERMVEQTEPPVQVADGEGLGGEFQHLGQEQLLAPACAQGELAVVRLGLVPGAPVKPGHRAHEHAHDHEEHQAQPVRGGVDTELPDRFEHPVLHQKTRQERGQQPRPEPGQQRDRHDRRIEGEVGMDSRAGPDRGAQAQQERAAGRQHGRAVAQSQVAQAQPPQRRSEFGFLPGLGSAATPLGQHRDAQVDGPPGPGGAGDPLQGRVPRGDEDGAGQAGSDQHQAQGVPGQEGRRGASMGLPEQPGAHQEEARGGAHHEAVQQGPAPADHMEGRNAAGEGGPHDQGYGHQAAQVGRQQPGEGMVRTGPAPGSAGHPGKMAQGRQQEGRIVDGPVQVQAARGRARSAQHPQREHPHAATQHQDAAPAVGQEGARRRQDDGAERQDHRTIGEKPEQERMVPGDARIHHPDSGHGGGQQRDGQPGQPPGQPDPRRIPSGRLHRRSN